MDDQQGHVIDGTARARQWRRSKPKTGSAPDAPETRSDAPKSFAGSLLVPADMLPAAFPPDERLNENEQGRAAAPPPRADADRGRPGVGRERRSPEPVPRPRSRPCRASLEVHAPANDRGAAREPTWVDQRPPRAISTSAPPRGNAPLAGRAAPDPPAGACGFDRRRRGHGCDRHAPERRPSVVHVCSRRSRATRCAARGGLSPRRATRSRNRQQLAIERHPTGCDQCARTGESPRTGDRRRRGNPRSCRRGTRRRHLTRAARARARQPRATRSPLPPRLPRSRRHRAEAQRLVARAQAAAVPHLEKTEPSAQAGAPPAPSKETPVQCSRPSPSSATTPSRWLALFVALGGTSYAALQPSRRQRRHQAAAQRRGHREEDRERLDHAVEARRTHARRLGQALGARQPDRPGSERQPWRTRVGSRVLQYTSAGATEFSVAMRCR